MNHRVRAVCLVLLAGLWCYCLSGCQKFLEAKPDKKLVVVSNLQDLQALLDFYPRINWFDPGNDEASADDYYLTTADWAALPEAERRTYIWEKDHLFRIYPNEWSYSYDNVYKANTVLDHINAIPRGPGNQLEWDNIKGQALVLRAKTFQKVAFIWAMAYDPATASTDLGIPLRLTPDFNEPSVRSSVEQTYQQIIQDLKEAVPLLPVKPTHLLRASKPAAYALLARTFLSMRQYEAAGAYADSCLRLYNTLLEYNTLNAAATYPFESFNAEVIMDNVIPVPSALNNARGKIDSFLYRSYAENDLRKQLYFKSNGNNTYGFRGSYANKVNLFSGVATDEVYLMRAEARARAGKIVEAMNDLNTLLRTRWRAGTFVPFTAADKEEALRLILEERRKELVMRGLRWMDIKRFNKEGAGRTLTRIVNGQTYVLPPNDLRYALPIPEDVVAISGMPQNPR